MEINDKIKKCAIIGNSPYLLYSSHGEQIDDYEVVIRCNAAITQGFEKYVGSKTDYRMVNIHVANWICNGSCQEKEKHLKSLEPRQVIKDGDILICKDFQSDSFGQRYKPIEWDAKRRHKVTCEAYYLPKQALLAYDIWKHSATGTYAAALARLLFPNAEICCYGFSFYENLKEECHYFEELAGKTLCHDFKRDKKEFEKIPFTRLIK